MLPSLTLAQVDVDDDDEDGFILQDTVTGFSAGKIVLPNPSSIVAAYTYDPITDHYVYNNSLDDYDMDFPIILTPQEYEELVLKQSMRDYFRRKLKALDGKDITDDERRDLLPKYYVDSGIFETIFGGNTIDIQPRGSVEMDLGIRHNRIDNPSFSPRNRQNTTFDFEQRISMSMTGTVGTRLNVNVNYDTQSTFAFQNLIKLEYRPTEDDILQKIEVGNVNMPLNSSLIRGAQSLFGVKAQLQFGRTTVTGVFSEQKSQTRSVTAEGGGTIENFELFALDYDADRHFFLSHYFRNRYDEALRNYPFINTRVQITRLEVWVTNRQNRFNAGPDGNNLRNIVAIQDLGESQIFGLNDNRVVGVNPIPPSFFQAPPNSPSRNSNNRFDPAMIRTGGGLLNSQIREIATSQSGFAPGLNMVEGRDWAKLENARKLSPNEYTFHPQLGYISLQQRLTNDEVLAVAFQYTIGDQVFQVGEFGNDGVEATLVDNAGIPVTQALVLKMLKSTLTNVNQPVWDLMMKNVYQIPGGGMLTQEDFRMNILYTNPSPLNFIVPAQGATLPEDVAETPLLRVFNLDRLNMMGDPQPGGDGFFDFIPGLTVDPMFGRIIFTTVEPFGKHLFQKLSDGAGEDYDNPATYNPNQNRYVFRTMYRSTQAAALQDSEKNMFQLRGRYKSSGGDGIPIGAFNVPPGSVMVSAGGRVLVEGQDYVVNYQIGRVRILDPSLEASGIPIEISVENNAVFGQQTRRFMGVNVEHQINKNFVVGGTFLKMTERPFTQKSNFGQESVNNTIFGFNTNYSTEVPLFTRLVNKLPNIDTDVPSMLSVRAETAFLRPDSPRADNFNGEATLYVDDFEGSITTIDVMSPFAWQLSSVPARNPDSPYNFNENASDLSHGYKRAKLSWYTIDPIFFTASRPQGVTDVDLSFNKSRRVFIQELFPVNDIPAGNTTVINTLDLTYYPRERGPYNFNPEVAGGGEFSNPEDNFGGITRAITSTNFEQGNVEFIQFWVMDPYINEEHSIMNQGKIYFNLGEISEDILKDGRKQYENGLPGPGQTTPTIETIWGRVPASQSLVYAFDANNANREAQDVGLDGLNDAAEATFFPNFAGFPDPAADNYQFYLNVDGDVLQRYKNYNGLDGNSPVNIVAGIQGNTTLPDVEDLNRDNTMNTINAYFEYSIDIRPGMQVGENFITDIREVSGAPIPGPGGQTTNARWIQFKIPVMSHERVIGGISDFRSIRFMRMFMTGFNDQMTIRFGTLELVRGEWRRFENTLDPNDPDPTDDDTNFDVLTVNIQENSNRVPIPYVTPPGVVREQLFFNNTVINQNEQSLALRVTKRDAALPGLGGLEPGDARAVFKNLDVDMRQFNKLRMFLHAEALPIPPEVDPLLDDEMVAFIRFGNDFSENFYQVEIPLKVTPQMVGLTPEQIWPQINEMDLDLRLLTQLKLLSLGQNAPPVDPQTGIIFVNETDLDPSLFSKPTAPLRLGIRGNPNFGLVRTLMLGIKNVTNNAELHSVPKSIRGEVWFNELRVSDMNNQGGMAALLNVDTNMADFATVSATGRMSTIGFGALEQGANERSREDMLQYDVVTNLNLGMLLPNKWGIRLPFNYAIGEQIITPEYDPFFQDVRLNQILSVAQSDAERDNARNRAIDYTKRRSINFIGVRKDRAPEQKQRIYDVENFTLTHSFTQIDRHNFEVEDYVDQMAKSAVDYAYAFQAKPVEPFKKSNYFKKNRYWQFLRDLNFNYLPQNVAFSANIQRQFNRQQFRQIDVEGIGLPALFQRNYLFNYNYGFNYNLTKSIKINYDVNTQNIVRNYIDAEGFPDQQNIIWDDYWNIGQPNMHNQRIILNYDLPFAKFPFLAFVKSTYSYTGTFNWMRSSFALQQVETEDGVFDLGNTVQNSGAHRINTTLNMTTFYRYIGLVKAPKPPQRSQSGPPKPGERVQNTRQPQQKESSVFVEGLRNLATSVKNIQLNYVHNTGAMLPGYLPTIGFFGTSRPSLPFAFGFNDDIRSRAAASGWLSDFPDFNQNYTEMVTKTINLTAKVDPFPDLTIDLIADRNQAENFSEQFDVTNGVYNSRSPFFFGNYSISTNMIRTSFSSNDINNSAAFEQFRANRITVAERLATNYYGPDFPRVDDPNNPNFGFPVGFGRNSQAVLIPAFLAAYEGRSASGISLGAFREIPNLNWTIKYSGFMRYQFFKDRFRRFSVQHAYRASYTISQYLSNFEFTQNPNGLEPNSGNFYNRTLIQNVALTEQFNPLIRFDVEMKNSMRVLAEMRKDRALSLSFDNNLLTEVQGLEYILGLGYRIKDVVFSSSLADNPTGTIKSDVNIRADLSLRDNRTIVRFLDFNNNELVGGQNIWSLRLTADYAFSKQLTVIFYYDHMFSEAVISTAFPMTNIRSGFTFRYNFGN